MGGGVSSGTQGMANDPTKISKRDKNKANLFIGVDYSVDLIT